MASVTLKGNPQNTNGELPPVGQQAPDFTLVNTDLADVKLSDFQGKRVVLNVFRCIVTRISSQSVRHFDAEVSASKNSEDVYVPQHLPFSLARPCGAEGLDQVTTENAIR